MRNPQVSGDVTLYPVENVRDLGVKVSSDLSWSKHVGDMVTKARSKLSWVLSVFKTRGKVVMMTLYKSLVRSWSTVVRCGTWSRRQRFSFWRGSSVPLPAALVVYTA